MAARADVEPWLAEAIRGPAFWTAVASISAASISGWVAIATARRSSRTADRTAAIAELKEKAAASTETQNSLNASFKMFTDNVMAMLAAERTERAAERTSMADDIRKIKATLSRALTHIKSLEKLVLSLGTDPPPRPEGLD